MSTKIGRVSNSRRITSCKRPEPRLCSSYQTSAPASRSAVTICAAEGVILVAVADEDAQLVGWVVAAMRRPFSLTLYARVVAQRQCWSLVHCSTSGQAGGSRGPNLTPIPLSSAEERGDHDVTLRRTLLQAAQSLPS